MIQFTQFEKDVLAKLVDGDEWVLEFLRTQISNAKIEKRTLTGHGFFLDFIVDNQELAIPGNPSFVFGDVSGEIEGLLYGGGFLLFIENGLISCLEGYSYCESWPEEPFQYRLYYDTGDRPRAPVLPSFAKPPHSEQGQ